MAWTSPRLSARDASFSHSLVKRWISTSSGASARRLDEECEGASGVDGLELVGIADEQHLGARACGDPGEPIECLGVGESGLVDDHQLATAEFGPAVVILMEPLRRVLARDAEVVGQRLGRGGGRRQTDHAPPPVLRGPRCSERSHRGGLACPGRPDQYVDLAARLADALHRTTLLRAQLDLSSRGRSPRNARGHRRRGHLLGTTQQARLGIEHRGRGVLLAVPRTEPARAVLALEPGRAESRAPAESGPRSATAPRRRRDQ